LGGDDSMVDFLDKEYDKKEDAIIKQFGLDKATSVEKAKAAAEKIKADNLKGVVPGEVNIVDPDHKKYYDDKFAEYGALLSDPNIDLQGLAESDFPVIKDALRIWQGDTNRPSAMALRMKAAKIEGLNEADIVWTRMGAERKPRALEMLEGMSDEEYLNMRALNQAYMTNKKEAAVELFRGTDGRTGKVIAADILENKPTTISFRDRIIGGTSSDESRADAFGLLREGITVRSKVPKENIMVHKDLMSGITGAHEDEKEYIVISKPPATYDIKDVSVAESSFDKGWE